MFYVLFYLVLVLDSLTKILISGAFFNFYFHCCFSASTIAENKWSGGYHYCILWLYSVRSVGRPGGYRSQPLNSGLYSFLVPVWGIYFPQEALLCWCLMCQSLPMWCVWATFVWALLCLRLLATCWWKVSQLRCCLQTMTTATSSKSSTGILPAPPHTPARVSAGIWRIPVSPLDGRHRLQQAASESSQYFWAGMTCLAQGVWKAQVTQLEMLGANFSQWDRR